MKTAIVSILNLLAKLTIRRFKPLIVGITGSVGKTSAKEAVLAALSPNFSVRASIGSYNNEFGLPLTILGFKTQGKNLLGWIRVFAGGALGILKKNYPEILVLEMGADRERDIEKLLSVAGKIDIAVITDIGISHLENYPSHEHLIREKLSILDGLKIGGLAVINKDNKYLVAALKNMQGKAVTYSLGKKADVWASDVRLQREGDEVGIAFVLSVNGEEKKCMLKGLLGHPSVYAALAAAAVALAAGLKLEDFCANIGKYEGVAGRLRLIKGIKRTHIIDDTYNAAPSSTIAALEALSEVALGRKIAALGEMAELGLESISGHKQVAAKIMDVGVDAVFFGGK
jgi:UDP-N-acetylmuramyl pentapeptide synthase